MSGMRLWVPGPWFSWRESVKVGPRKWAKVEKRDRHPCPKGRGKIARVAKQRVKGVMKHRAFLEPHPKEVAAQEALVVALLPHRPGRPWDVSVRCDLEVIYQPPRSWPAWRIEAALARAVRPNTPGTSERSNITKMVDDALEAAGFVTDDSRIVEGEPAFWYGSEPGYLIELAPLPPEPASAAEWKQMRAGVA